MLWHFVEQIFTPLPNLISCRMKPEREKSTDIMSFWIIQESEIFGLNIESKHTIAWMDTMSCDVMWCESHQHKEFQFTYIESCYKKIHIESSYNKY